MRILTFGLVVTSTVFAQDPVEIMQKSIARSTSDYELLRNYTFIQREEQKFFDKNGKVTKTESETYEISIIGQRPYSKKIAYNDKPLSEKEASKEQQKLEKE